MTIPMPITHSASNQDNRTTTLMVSPKTEPLITSMLRAMAASPAAVKEIGRRGPDAARDFYVPQPEPLAAQA